MDQHIKEFYSHFSNDTPHGHFHKVISVDKDLHLDWENVKQKVPDLCRGWYELSQLSPKDRIDFTQDFWLSKLPFRPNLQESINKFFALLDDILVFLVQNKFDDPFEAHLVYSLKEDKGFFSGGSPASDENIVQLQAQFPEYIFPEDYTAFLQIHNGFFKTTDSTGIIKSSQMYTTYSTFQKQFVEQPKEGLLTTGGMVVDDPHSLIPFYESFGMPFYQCFWGEWYPENEMGNVYFSGQSKTISDIRGEPGPESMAFVTFLDWLMFYLEIMDNG